MGLLRKSGQEMQVLLSSSALTDEAGNLAGIVVVAKDVTERERLMAAEREERLMAQALCETSSALSGSLEYEAVLDSILAGVGKVVPHESANVMVLEDGVARILRHDGYESLHMAEWLEQNRPHIDAYPLFTWMNQMESAMVVPDTRECDVWAGISEMAWVRSYVGAPIRLEGEVIGFLNVADRKPGCFDADDGARLQAFADQIAVAIKNARLFGRVQEYAADLERRVVERTEMLRANGERLVKLNEGFLQFGPSALDNISALTCLCGELMEASGAVYGHVEDDLLRPWASWLAPECSGQMTEAQVQIGCDLVRSGDAGLQVIRDVDTTCCGQIDSQAETHGLQTYVGLPVTSAESTVGILCVAYQRDFEPTEDQIRYIEIIAAAVGVEEERKSAQDELDRHRAHLEELVAERTARLSALNEKLSDSLEEKQAMLQEIHHRVKNNLQIVSSLLSLQAQQADDELVSQMLVESRNRVHSMALVHQRLYQSKDLACVDASDYINGLAQQLLSSYGVLSGRVQLELDVDGIDLSVDTAIPCALILNELVTNALKHAFPDGRRGKLLVTMRSLGDNHLEMIVSDDGVGLGEPVASDRADSLGLSLVSTLARQMDATMAIDTSQGTVFRFEFDRV